MCGIPLLMIPGSCSVPNFLDVWFLWDCLLWKFRLLPVQKKYLLTSVSGSPFLQFELIPGICFTHRFRTRQCCHLILSSPFSYVHFQTFAIPPIYCGAVYKSNISFLGEGLTTIYNIMIVFIREKQRRVRIWDVYFRRHKGFEASAMPQIPVMRCLVAMKINQLQNQYIFAGINTLRI